MRKFLSKYICLPLALALFCGCSLKEDGDIPDTQARVRFDVTAHKSFGTSDGVILSTVRIIAVDKDGTIAYNKSTKNGLLSKPGEDDTFEIKLPAGNYRLYTVANETPAMSTALDAAGSVADLQKIEVKGSFTEENVPLLQSEQIVLRQLQNGLPQISADGGGTWQNKLTTELVRTQSKVTLHLRKKTYTLTVDGTKTTFAAPDVKFSPYLLVDPTLSKTGTDVSDHHELTGDEHAVFA